MQDLAKQAKDLLDNAQDELEVIIASVGADMAALLNEFHKRDLDEDGSIAFISAASNYIATIRTIIERLKNNKKWEEIK